MDTSNIGATDEDIKMWEQEGKDDILEWVDTIQLGDDHCIHDIWISPVIHDDVKRCPWLRKLPNQDRYVCRIHDAKPEHCSSYRLSKRHAEKTGCKGFGD